MPESRFASLTDDNYHEWIFFMEALLIKKSLFGVVNGSIAAPLGSTNSKAVKDFVRKQQEARSEIVLNVSVPQLEHCRDPDPKVIWETLDSVHNSRGRSTVISLRRRFHRLRLEENETMASFIARTRHLAFLLKAASFPVDDDDIILAITSGLPASYDPFLITLDATPDDDYTLTLITPRLVNEYQRQQMSSEPLVDRLSDPVPSSDVAYAASVSARMAKITCFGCGKKGHYQSNCPTNPAPYKPKPKPALLVGSATVEEEADSEYDGIW